MATIRVFKHGQLCAEIKLDPTKNYRVGRDPKNEIVLPDESGISRFHLSIEFQESTWVISSQSKYGQLVFNGRSVHTIKLNANNRFSIPPFEFEFTCGNELEDTVLAEIQPSAFFSGYDCSARNSYLSERSNWLVGVLPKPKIEHLNLYTDAAAKDRRNRKKACVATAVAFALILFAGLLKNSVDFNGSQVIKENNFTALPEHQQEIIQAQYAIAKDSMLKKEFAIAKVSLQRVHEIIPRYLNSRAMLDEAKSGISILQQIEAINADKLKKIEFESEVAAAVSECRSNSDEKWTPAIFKDCLGEIYSLAPDHSSIREFEVELEQLVKTRETHQASEQLRANKIRRAKAMFKKAVDLEANGNDHLAITAFREFIEGNFDEPLGLRKIASQKIIEIEKQRNVKIDGIVTKAISFFERSEFEKGMKVLAEAKRVDPKNQRVVATYSKYKRINHRNMKRIFTDSVLDEGIGNIESAKDRWRTILQSSYPGSKYYRKAKSKLFSYEE